MRFDDRPILFHEQYAILTLCFKALKNEQFRKNTTVDKIKSHNKWGFEYQTIKKYNNI